MKTAKHVTARKVMFLFCLTPSSSGSQAASVWLLCCSPESAHTAGVLTRHVLLLYPPHAPQVLLLSFPSGGGKTAQSSFAQAQSSPAHAQIQPPHRSPSLSLCPSLSLLHPSNGVPLLHSGAINRGCLCLDPLCSHATDLVLDPLCSHAIDLALQGQGRGERASGVRWPGDDPLRTP